jgi:signal transduction histidine kinase
VLEGTSSEARMIALGRLILAASGLLVIYLVPTEPDRLVPVVYASLSLYTLFSGGVYLIERRGGEIPWMRHWGHWIDVASYTVLITLSSGTNSIFFFGYFLPILAASFRWGFGSGMRIALTSTFSAILFTALAAFTPVPNWEPQRYLIRPAFLLTLGYMIARWGDHELELKRRLELLRELATSANPRFGMNRTLGRMMHRLTGHFGAAGCALVLREPEAKTCTLRRTVGEEDESVPLPQELPESVTQLLLGLPQDAVVVHAGAGLPRAFHATGGDRLAVDADACEAIAAALDSASFLSVPLAFRDKSVGRLYLRADGAARLDEADARFLLHAMGQALPLIENLRLVTQLATAAAEDERRKIARDIHDSVIQPYVGIQIGLSGLRQKLLAGTGGDLAGDLDRLLDMTSVGLADLRLQVSALKAGGARGVSLVPAVRRFASRFSEVTGIAVAVQAEDDLLIEDRLAAEAFQMVAEGLSNVRRHTQSPQATIGLALQSGSLQLRIENEAGAEPCDLFTPRSIVERAAALGGDAKVRTGAAGATVVLVEVPL